MLVICYQVTSHPAIEWLPDSKSLAISISYRLPCGLFKHFTSWLFIGCFETDQTLCSQGRGSFNQGKIAAFLAPAKLLSGLFSNGDERQLYLGMCWRSWSCVRIRVLLSTFRFSVCNCGVKNGLWSLSSPIDPCCTQLLEGGTCWLTRDSQCREGIQRNCSPILGRTSWEPDLPSTSFWTSCKEMEL